MGASYGTLRWQTYGLQTTRVEIPVDDLPSSLEGFTFLHLSDLHERRFGPGQSRLLRLIDSLEFDCAVLTGDMFDSTRVDHEAVALLAKRLVQRAPTYYVSGNHEVCSPDEKEQKRVLRRCGVGILDGRVAKLEHDGARLWLLGTSSPYLRPAGLKRLLSQTKGEGPRVLLVHEPLAALGAAELGIDLVLSGHTHGGQVQLPFLSAFYVPGEGFFPQFVAGLHRLQDTHLYINRGLGTGLVPVRFLSRPEVALIRLVPAASDQRTDR